MLFATIFMDVAILSFEWNLSDKKVIKNKTFLQPKCLRCVVETKCCWYLINQFFFIFFRNQVCNSHLTWKPQQCWHVPTLLVGKCHRCLSSINSTTNTSLAQTQRGCSRNRNRGGWMDNHLRKVAGRTFLKICAFS